jgi:hypothetical protein
VTTPGTATSAAPVSLSKPDAPAVESDSQDPTPSTASMTASASEATPRYRADPGAAARMFDAATTRRRSVVFEEDDELDVPDFLK